MTYIKTRSPFWMLALGLSLGSAACGSNGVVSRGDDYNSNGDDVVGGGDDGQVGGGDGQVGGGDGQVGGGDGQVGGGDGQVGGDSDVIWPVTSEGWTVITPSQDSRIVYVSNSAGSDTNDGLSAGSPVKTVTKGASLLRDGYPDHLLLRRGDTWTGESLGRFKSGRSTDEPMVISSYGDSGARPLLRIASSFINHDGNSRSYFALLGLALVSYKMDPDDPDFTGSVEAPLRLVGSGEGILIEDCLLRFVELIIQGYNGDYDGVVLRRNIVLDAYALGTSTSGNRKPSGLYLSSVRNITMEENVFDHNGWSEEVATAGANQYNHNIYIQYGNLSEDIVFRNNIVTRASSHGVHGRPGGLYENNLFIANSIGLQMGYKDHPLPSGSFATARDNVILEGKLMDVNNSSAPRTSAVWGLNLDELGAATVTVERNIVAHRRNSGSNVGIRSLNGVSYLNNVQYKWGGGLGDMSNASWLDPERSIGSYNATLGGAATFDDFLAAIRNRPGGTWDPDYTAPVINEYFREGFNLDN